MAGAAASGRRLRVIAVERQRVIGLAPAELWDLAADPARYDEWFDSCERSEVVDGTGLGRRQRMHGRWNRKVSLVEQTITRWRPPHELAWRHDREMLDGRPAPEFARKLEVILTITPEGSDSRVDLRITMQPTSFLKGVLMRLTAGLRLGRSLNASLTALAELAEAPAGQS